MVNDTQQIPAGYKQTDVGVIPNDWEVVELQRLALDMLQGINTAIDKPEYVSDGVPMFKANNIIDQTLSYTNMDYISYRTYSRYSERFKIKKNDFLFSNIGARLGTGSLFTGNEECSFAWNVMRIVPNEELVNPAFLAISINSPKISDEIKNNQSGSGMGFVPKGVMKKIGIPLPEKKEQEKITEVLSDIDSLISKLDQLIQKKKNIIQGTMQELLTGKRRLPGFSGVWMQFPLSDILLLNKGEQLNRSDLFNTGLYPAWNGGIDPSGYTDKWNTKENTITISEGGNSCGFVNICRQKFWCGGHCYAIKIKLKDLQNLFLYYALKYQEVSIMNLRVGSGLPNIQKKRLYGYELSIPADVSEQKEISNVLFDLDAELDLLEKQKLKYQNLRQGMMQQLLTGKIRLI